MFTKRIAEINARKAELRKLLETDANANLDEIETELRDLDTEMQSIERRRTIASGISAGTVLGGQGLIADKAVRDIFRMEDGNNIVPISK